MRLRSDLRRFLSKALPAIPDEQEDLLQDTLLDLTREVQERSEVYPASWWQETSKVPGEDRERFRRLARTILRRRIVDRFAQRAKEWAQTRPGFARVEGSPTTDPSPERRYLAAQMLRICIEVLADASEEDRRIIARVTSGEYDKDRVAFSTRERQRLRRLRATLASAILQQLGSSASELLTEAE